MTTNLDLNPEEWELLLILLESMDDLTMEEYEKVRIKVINQIKGKES